MTQPDLDFYRELLEQVRLDDQRVGIIDPTLPQPIRENITVAWCASRNPFMGGEYYRATRPAALANRGFDWHTAVVEQIGSLPGSKKVAGQAFNSDHVVEPHVWIFRPIGQQGQNDQWGLEEIVERIHAGGQKVIADLDDDIWSHEDWNEDERPADENDDKYETWCWKVDGWLVSTPWLKERVETIGKKRGHSPKVFVAPNCYDPVGLGMYSHPRPGRRLGTRLWLSGRMSGDVEIYRECFTPLLDELDLSFTHIGRETLVEEGPGRHQRNFVDDVGMPAHRVFELGSCAIPELGHLLGEHVNIAAIAMADHPFNYAKTETHAVEVASAGLPIVAATSLSIYDKVPGRVDPNIDAVRQRVKHLLDPDVWKWESNKARGWAKKTAVRAETLYCRALQAMVREVLL